MNITPDQKKAVASWVSAGDNLSTVQKKLAEQFKLTLTYMNVRFIVDDLDLTLKDPKPAPSAQTDLSKIAPATSPAQQHPTAADEPPLDGPGQNPYADQMDESDEGVPPHPTGEMPPPQADTNVRVEVDNVTLIPGAIASGSVTFTDGVTGKWLVDQYGRPGFTQISQPGYRPTPADGQAFMEELNNALQKKGF